MDYPEVIARLVSWASGRDDVRALVLNGSAAAGTADALSDRDVEVFTTDPGALLEDESWWSGLGRVLIVERLHDQTGDPTRLLYYRGGKLDFTVRPADALAGRTYASPFRMLLDKDDLGRTLSHVEPVRPSPTPDELEESISWAWAAALMCGKAIVRDEPWAATLRDRDLKDELLRLLEWDHQVRHGPDLDVRFAGRGLRRWVDDEVQTELADCWGRFDVDDLRRALLRTVDLYVRLAVRTAQRLGFPAFDHEQLRCELADVLRNCAP